MSLKHKLLLLLMDLLHQKVGISQIFAKSESLGIFLGVLR